MPRMNYKIFDDKIIVPVKCGTRYCEKIFPTYDDSSNGTIYRYGKFRSKPYWHVYREPISHLISALHTELLSVWNGVEDMSVEALLDRFTRDGGTTHWTRDVCKKLHNFWSYNRHIVNLVELSQLTSTLETLGYATIDYNETDYDFKHYKNWYSKEECVDLIQRKYPQHWELLYSCALEDTVYYEKLNNRERLSIKLF